MFIKPCSLKQGGGSGGSEERRRKVSEFARQTSEDLTKSRRRKVSDLREELLRQASDEQARNRRRKASELREAFARRGESVKEGRQEERRSREKSQEGSISAKSPSPISHYRVLGVDEEASSKEIRKAFLEKVRECHPDRHTEAEAETRMKEVTSSYSVLSDPQSRAEYDKARRIRSWVGASSTRNSENSSSNQSFRASKDEDEANFEYKGIFKFLFGSRQ